MRQAPSFVIAAMLGASLPASTMLAGCSRIKSNQGYIVDEQLVASVQPGVDNRASVQRLLGRPTFTSEFDNSRWYYISRNTTQLAFLNPKPKSQNILTITFDAKGNVAKVDRKGLEQVVSVSPVKEKTPVLGRHDSLFNALFGNIGQFGASQGGVGSPTAGTGRDGPR